MPIFVTSIIAYLAIGAIIALLCLRFWADESDSNAGAEFMLMLVLWPLALMGITCELVIAPLFKKLWRMFERSLLWWISLGRTKRAAVQHVSPRPTARPPASPVPSLKPAEPKPAIVAPVEVPAPPQASKFDIIIGE